MSREILYEDRELLRSLPHGSVLYMQRLVPAQIVCENGVAIPGVEGVRAMHMLPESVFPIIVLLEEDHSWSQDMEDSVEAEEKGLPWVRPQS